MNKPTPLVLLSGFLGSGKTTVLNHLLGSAVLHNRRVAVIVNEFGELGVDGYLLRAGNYHRYDLNKGSIFCICLKTDLLSVFHDIDTGVKADVVLVEATGLAEPRDLAGILEMPRLAERFQVTANVCVVDPLNWPKLVPTLKPAANQVREADLLVLNKADITDAATLTSVELLLRTYNNRAPVLRTSYGQIELAPLLKPHATRNWNGVPRDRPPEGIHSVVLEIDASMDRRQFYELLAQWQGSLLRLKGVVCFGDGPLFVEVAGGRISSRPVPTALQNLRTTTAVVLIVQDLDPELVRSRLQDCILRP